MANTDLRLGIDLGGTKIEAVLLDAESEIVARQRLSTPTEYTAILEAIKALADELAPSSNTPVGIGTPGSVSKVSPLIRNSNSTCLNGKPLQQDLENQLERKVKMANDADCFALSEASDGAATMGDTVFGVILGTGVGGGLVIDGKLLTGVNGISGEWGHNPMPGLNEDNTSRSCFCGKQDCIETWLSGPGVALSYHAETGIQQSAKEIAEAAAPGTMPDNFWDRYCRQLAAAIATVINVVDPDIIVLGGGLSNMDILYQQVPVHLTKFVFSDHVATRIVRAKHGDSSGVRGAAWLWPSPEL